MYKLFGLASIVTASVMTGFLFSYELRERIKSLSETYCALLQIKSDFEYRAPVLEECFRSRGRLFDKASEYIGDGFMPCDAVKKACGEIPSLKREDREIINSFAENLVAEEISGQLANINWLISCIEERISHAEAEYDKKSRLYKSSGALLGMGFIILLL